MSRQMSRQRGSGATEEGGRGARQTRGEWKREERRLGGEERGERREPQWDGGYRGGGTWPADFCGGGTCWYLPPGASSLAGGYQPPSKPALGKAWEDAATRNRQPPMRYLRTEASSFPYAAFRYESR
ncbi:hypothetical protein, variant 1 [Blastomyces dermatitidis ER-3]|uniref:Uncharacterized protein n=2 Tax=Ajellomyces dermatitidis TaxID=5039 RepID=F2T2E9_AJEDA|nr:hypothetical protein, variant 1 [Blastomyces dermatitidis ER-3]EGE77633.2 hypothetical protein BDDG_00570 [Blastomyces dermatitidis ATCC 18188]OAT00663.1 hypothetical protein, variant 1 [Blastomyces dermatitidis ER-3]